MPGDVRFELDMLDLVLPATHQATRIDGATSISHDNECVKKHVLALYEQYLPRHHHCSRIRGNHFGVLPGKATLVTAHSSASLTGPIATHFSLWGVRMICCTLC